MRRSLILLAAAVGALVAAAPAPAFRMGHGLRPVAGNPAAHVDIEPDPELLDGRLSSRAVARATIPLVSRAWLTRRP
jgi:hypothetical protein